MGDVLRRHGKLYIRWYDADGRRRQRATECTSVREARALLAELEAEVARQRRVARAHMVEPPSTATPIAMPVTAPAAAPGPLTTPVAAPGPLTTPVAAPGPLTTPAVTPIEPTRQPSLTVAELADRFFGLVEGERGYTPARVRDLAAYRRACAPWLRRHILPALGHRPAASVTVADVERLRDRMLADGYAAASYVKAHAVLSKMYAWARRVGLVDATVNPTAGVDKPRPAETVDYLSRAEVTALLAHVEEHAADYPPGLYAMIATAVYCGLRKGELYGLRWRDVVFDAARLDVNRSYRSLPKNGKPRHVPMPPELVPILRRWRAECPSTDEGLVFPVRGARGWHMGDRTDMHGLPEAFAAAGVHAPADGKYWHVLRHTYASHAVMSGVPLYAVQRLLGHASPQMTQRYAHLAPDYLGAEVARLSFAEPAPAGVTPITSARARREGK